MRQLLCTVLAKVGLLKYKVMIQTDYFGEPINVVKLPDGGTQSDCVIVLNFFYRWYYSIHEGVIRFGREGGNGTVVINEVDKWFVVP